MGDGPGMRVALVSFEFGEYCTSLANGLARKAQVTLFLPEGHVEPVGEQIDREVQVVAFRKPRLRQPLRQLRMCRYLVREIRRTRPDVVHLQQGHLWFNLVLRALRRSPLVVTIHDHTIHPGDEASRKTPEAIMNLAFRRADEVIVHAETLRDEVVERRGLPRDHTHVVPHVALPGDPAAGPHRDFQDEEEGLVLFFGRIWPYKGLDVLIRSEPSISSRVPDAHFVIAGEGEDLTRYRAMMVNRERFTVINEFVSTAMRTELFRRAAVVVLPYLEASQSGVVPVAHSFGKPVVVTTVGGLPEAVGHGRSGLLVAPGDPVALADSVVRLLTDRGLRRRLGAAGRQGMAEESSPARVADRTAMVYAVAVGHVPSGA